MVALLQEFGHLLVYVVYLITDFCLLTLTCESERTRKDYKMFIS